MGKEQNSGEESNKKGVKRRPGVYFARFMAWFMASLLFLFVLLFLFIRSTWGQDIIVRKATNYLQHKIHTPVQIDKLYISFSGRLDLEGLYLQDQQGDTLIYSKELQAAIPIIPMLRGKPLALQRVSWDGLTANVIRRDSLQGFNFQYIIDAFSASTDEQKTKNEKVTKNEEHPEISVGNIDFSNFRLVYSDSVLGIDSKLNLGELRLKGRKTDLNRMIFALKSIEIKNTSGYYHQIKAFPPSSDTSSTVLPIIDLDKVDFDHVHLNYTSVPDTMQADAVVNHLKIRGGKLDLPQQIIRAEALGLYDSNASFSMADNTPEEEVSQEKSSAFPWPDWALDFPDISLQNNDLAFQIGDIKNKPEEFNYKDMAVENSVFTIKDFHVSKTRQFAVKFDKIDFKEKSGLTLHNSEFSLKGGDTGFILDDLKLNEGENSISGTLEAKYNSFDELINNFEKIKFKTDISHFSIGLKDIFLFQPDLANNEYIQKLITHPFKGNLEAEGNLENMELKHSHVTWGNHTSANIQGNFKNITDPKQLYLAVPNWEIINTKKEDLYPFLADVSTHFRIPDTLQMSGNLYGRIDDLETTTILQSPDGTIQLEGKWTDGNRRQYIANVEAETLDIGKIMRNSALGKVSLKTQVKGEGSTLQDIDAAIKGTISSFTFNKYHYKGLKIDGAINSGKGKVQLSYADDNLILNLENMLFLDSLQQRVVSDLDVEKINPKSLNFIDQDFVAKLNLHTDFLYHSGDLSLQAKLRNTTAQYQGKNLKLGEVDFSGALKDRETSFKVKSNFLNGEMDANANTTDIERGLKRQLRRYFTDSIQPLDSIKNPIRLEANFTWTSNPLINSIFIPKVIDMKPVALEINFDQKKEELTSSITLPQLNYNNNVINQLYFYINSTENAGNYILGFDKLDAGIFSLNKTFINGNLAKGVLTTNFIALDDNDDDFYTVHSEISGKDEHLRFHLLNENLILNHKEWTIPKSNEILFGKGKITATDFVLSEERQKLAIANDLIDRIKRDNLGIHFENFKISTLLALFNPKRELAEGDIQGNIEAIKPRERKKIAILGDLKIDQLKVLTAPLGNLSMRAFALGTDRYRFKATLKGEDIDAETEGKYTTGKNGGVELKTNIRKLGFKTVAALSQGELTDAKGYLSGEFNLEGSSNNPTYSGALHFNDASFRVAQLNNIFKMSNDEIRINNKGFLVKDFRIKDPLNHDFLIDGYILTHKFVNPEFHLDFKTTNFQAMNSTEKDNPTYYGKLNFDIDGSLTGRWSLPQLNFNLKINKNSDLTYVMSESQAAIESREGVVKFVDKSREPEERFRMENDTTSLAKVKGIKLDSKIKVDKAAKVKVITDPRAGDNLEISGDADLSFRIDENGRMNLSGIYTVNQGHYEMTLYKLVNRKFDFKPGSTVTWSGSPMDADLNITATYSTKAPVSGLMSGQSSGGISGDNRYNERLPFIVDLNVKGSLNRPELNFGIDMPEDSRGALNGAVYAQLQQLDENEGERNKQVFSLLVLQRFFPNSGSDGGEGGFANIAKDNLFDALGDQLSAFSNQLMGNTGVQLSFGVDSYTDYQGDAAQQRTDINISAQKKLFNDRLIIKAGTDVRVQGNTRPGEENPLLGNMSVEYLLTKDGRWRITGFRKNEYENIIDGQVFSNGIALMFQRDFNRFNYLFRSFFGDPDKYYARKRAERAKKKKATQKEKLQKEQKQQKQQMDSTTVRSKRDTENRTERNAKISTPKKGDKRELEVDSTKREEKRFKIKLD